MYLNNFFLPNLITKMKVQYDIKQVTTKLDQNKPSIIKLRSVPITKYFFINQNKRVFK